MGLYLDLKLEYSLPSMRNWAASPDFLLKISRLSENIEGNILECSCGVSTIVLAQRLKLNGKGHVFSLEHDPLFADKTKQELQRHNLLDWATIITAPLVKYSIGGGEHFWYSLDLLPKHISVDMIVIDGPPAHIGKLARYPAGPLLFHRLKNGGIIALDDSDRDDEKEVVSKWLHEFKDYEALNVDCEKGCVLLVSKA